MKILKVLLVIFFLFSLSSVNADNQDEINKITKGFLKSSPGNFYSAVRDSRMWCPHDIGRDSWVWGEQETLWIMDSPHELGGRSPHREDLVVGRKRGGPWVR